MTYEIDGEQYVAVMVGVGGAGQISYPAMMPQRPRLPGRLMVFKLGGTAKAPAFPPSPSAKIDLASLKSSGDAKRGFTMFAENCQVCHGPDASGAWLPDLKHSTIVGSSDDLRSVVLEGVLGSPRHGELLALHQTRRRRGYPRLSDQRGAGRETGGVSALNGS